MSYKIKNGKIVKSNVGDQFVVQQARDNLGRYWWRIDGDDVAMHGPFTTTDECMKDSEDRLFGPDCKMTWCGMLDPSWNKPQ